MIMSSIITAVLKATVGVLVDKARDKAAKKLREGDVIDKRIRDLIAREHDVINSKLDGISRKDLLAAIDAFQTGLEYWNQAMNAETRTQMTEMTEPRQEINEQYSSPSSTAAENTVALAAGMRNMELAELGEKTKRALSHAKDRFKAAREKAFEASNNEALSASDRVTAIKYRVMATMLESAVEVMETARNSSFVKDVLENAMPECKKCLQKLHSLPGVQNNFKVELAGKGILAVKGQLGKDERREIISAVCHVNRAIYDALQAAGEFTQLFDLPAVDIGEEKIDPLRDGRVAKVLEKVGMKHCCITCSFGQEGKEEHKLKNPVGIATNADGQFIIADDGDNTVKVFDSSGHFTRKFSPHTDDYDTKLNRIFDIATDEDSNIYVLVYLEKAAYPSYEVSNSLFYGGRASRGTTGRRCFKCCCEVLVFSSTADQLRKFPVDITLSERLTVRKNEVLVAWNRGIVLYETEGHSRWLGSGTLNYVIDITAGPDGRILVLDRGDDCIHVLTEDGQQLSKFSVRTKGTEYYRVACHPGGDHVIVAGYEGETRRLRVAIYTKDGEYQRTVTLDQTVSKNVLGIGGITLSMAGRISVGFVDQDENGKVIVF